MSLSEACLQGEAFAPVGLTGWPGFTGSYSNSVQKLYILFSLLELYSSKTSMLANWLQLKL